MLPQNSNLIKILVPLVGLVTLVVVGLVIAYVIISWLGLPPKVLGFGEGPDQPIAFPHTVHVQDAKIDCQFCHRTVTERPQASIPAVQQCMFCHATVDGNTPIAQMEIEKLREHWKNKEPINWMRVHRVPDHVKFVHEAHIKFFTETQDIDTNNVCSICHGDVGSMIKVEQVRSLKMGDCVDCHRDYNAPTDCTTCHY